MNIEDIKEFMQDKRNRAIVTLIIYVFFFIFVAYFCRAYKSEPLPKDENIKSPEEVYCEMANYEYTYIYKINDTENVITGKQFRTDNYFSYNDKNYYIKDNITYLHNEDEFIKEDLDFKIYNPSNICNMYKNKTLVSKNEDYENSYIASKYSFSSSNLDEETNDTLYVTLYEKDNTIFKIELDITNYAHINNETITKEIIDIEYSNIGNVTNFTSIFEEDKVVKGVE